MLLRHGLLSRSQNRALPMQLDSFTGGIFDTNCFYLRDSGILVDAPQEAAQWLQESGYKVSTLLLTHGHIDHVWDAARIQQEHGCRVGYHPDTEPMVTQRDFFKEFGLDGKLSRSRLGFTSPNALRPSSRAAIFRSCSSRGIARAVCVFWTGKKRCSLAAMSCLPAVSAAGTCREGTAPCSFGESRKNSFRLATTSPCCQVTDPPRKSGSSARPIPMLARMLEPSAFLLESIGG